MSDGPESDETSRFSPTVSALFSVAFLNRGR